MNQTPVAWIYETHYYPESRSIETGVVFERGVDTERTKWTPLFTEAQLNQARADALREAAENCFNIRTGDECARMIKGMLK